MTGIFPSLCWKWTDASRNILSLLILFRFCFDCFPIPERPTGCCLRLFEGFILALDCCFPPGELFVLLAKRALRSGTPWKIRRKIHAGGLRGQKRKLQNRENKFNSFISYQESVADPEDLGNLWKIKGDGFKLSNFHIKQTSGLCFWKERGSPPSRKPGDGAPLTYPLRIFAIPTTAAHCCLSLIIPMSNSLKHCTVYLDRLSSVSPLSNYTPVCLLINLWIIYQGKIFCL